MIRVANYIVLVALLVLVVGCASDGDFEEIEILQIFPRPVEAGIDGSIIFRATLNDPDDLIKSAGFEYATLESFDNKVTIDADIENSIAEATVPQQVFSLDTRYYYRAFVETDEIVYSRITSFTYDAENIDPTTRIVINSVSSLSGYPGSQLTITGEFVPGFGKSISIWLGNVECTALTKDIDSITVIVPPISGSALNNIDLPIKVQTRDTSVSYSDLFTVLSPWREMADPPFTQVNVQGWNANDFGRVYDHINGIVYSYDPINDEWLSLDTNAEWQDFGNVFYETEDFIFKLGGVFDDAAISEHWEYDLRRNFWSRKEDLPFDFSRPNSFTIDDDLHIVTDARQVWQYDPTKRESSRKNNIPGDLSSFGFVFEISDGHFFVDDSSTYKYDSNIDVWEQIAENAFSDHVHTIGFNNTNSAFVLNEGTDIYRFDVSNSQWVYATEYPGCSGNETYKTFFTVGNTIYIAATGGSAINCYPRLFQFEY